MWINLVFLFNSRNHDLMRRPFLANFRVDRIPYGVDRQRKNDK